MYETMTGDKINLSVNLQLGTWKIISLPFVWVDGLARYWFGPNLQLEMNCSDV